MRSNRRYKSPCMIMLWHKLAIIIIVFLVTSSVFTSQPLLAQDPIKARISLNFTNYNNHGQRLIAEVKYKEDNVYVPASGVKLDFYYINKEEEEQLLGSSVTLENGEIIFILPEFLKKTAFKEDQAMYAVRLENDKRFKDADSDVTVMPAEIKLETEDEDSVHIVRFFVGSPDSAHNVIPVSDVNAKIYVKRFFGELLISGEDEITDEEGYLTVVFPNDIPGDSSGELSIFARIEEHEYFGTLIASTKVDWGISTLRDDSMMKGELWSSRSNAPLYLVFFITSLLLLVWGVILFIFLKLFKIYRLGKQSV